MDALFRQAVADSVALSRWVTAHPGTKVVIQSLPGACLVTVKDPVSIVDWGRGPTVAAAMRQLVERLP